MDRILVGVTGKSENSQALQYAAREALARDCDVTLVHAVQPSLPPPPPSILTADNSWQNIARAILADADDELRSLTDYQVAVDVVAAEGRPGTVFGDLSRDASLVVLQHRDLSRILRIATGSTVASVARHVHCPVVSVPASAAGTHPHGVLTVGVHEDGGPPQVLEAAFAAAQVRRWEVRIVHARRLAATYDDMLLHDSRWRNEAHEAISAAAQRTAALFPDVQHAVLVRHDWPGDVLAALSRESDMLVMGRHGGRRGLVPEGLGSLTRAMLDHAHCPVMVVPLS